MPSRRSLGVGNSCPLLYSEHCPLSCQNFRGSAARLAASRACPISRGAGVLGLQVFASARHSGMAPEDYITEDKGLLSRSHKSEAWDQEPSPISRRTAVMVF